MAAKQPCRCGWSTQPAATTVIDTAADELARVWEATRHNRYLDPDTGQGLHPFPAPCRSCSATWPPLPTDGTPTMRCATHSSPADFRRAASGSSTTPPATSRKKLFAACRNGHVAVLIGSTEKMGVGTNIQTRAVHLMDLDAPWRPADVAQRHGRILRQGNQNPEIAITQVIENSFDAYMWQTLERKAAFIDQIMSGRGVNRTTGDIGDATLLNAAEAKALSSGNPLLLDLAVANKNSRLTRLERAHTTTQHTLATTLTHSQQGLESTKARIERLPPDGCPHSAHPRHPVRAHSGQLGPHHH